MLDEETNNERRTIPVVTLRHQASQVALAHMYLRTTAE
jgi:hypothetical protein